MKMYEVSITVEPEIAKAVEGAMHQVVKQLEKTGGFLYIFLINNILVKHPTLVNQAVPGYCVTAIVQYEVTDDRYPKFEA